MYLEVDNPRWSLTFTRLRLGVPTGVGSGCWPACLPNCRTSAVPILALAAAATFGSVQKGTFKQNTCK